MRILVEAEIPVDMTRGEIESYLRENRERAERIARDDPNQTPMDVARSHLAMKKVQDHLDERDDMRMSSAKNKTMEMKNE